MDIIVVLNSGSLDGFTSRDRSHGHHPIHWRGQKYMKHQSLIKCHDVTIDVRGVMRHDEGIQERRSTKMTPPKEFEPSLEF